MKTISAYLIKMQCQHKKEALLCFYTDSNKRMHTVSSLKRLRSTQIDLPVAPYSCLRRCGCVRCCWKPTGRSWDTWGPCHHCIATRAQTVPRPPRTRSVSSNPPRQHWSAVICTTLHPQQ